MAEEDKKKYGMGPGQSMAMAGNTGLASFTQKDIEKVQQAKREYNEFTGRDKNENATYTEKFQMHLELTAQEVVVEPTLLTIFMEMDLLEHLPQPNLLLAKFLVETVILEELLMDMTQ